MQAGQSQKSRWPDGGPPAGVSMSSDPASGSSRSASIRSRMSFMSAASAQGVGFVPPATVSLQMPTRSSVSTLARARLALDRVHVGFRAWMVSYTLDFPLADFLTHPMDKSLTLDVKASMQRRILAISP